MDLFRHELMHALGFGTLSPVSTFQKGPASILYNWTYSWDRSSQQLAKRHFLDFALNAAEVAKKHLGCPSLIGIEADSADKFHLNEYIFGNELMTPFLSNVANRFSYISAAILEETYFGDRPWYRVNRSAIRWEHNSLWYGRQWGCTFAEKSCFDFIADRIKSKKSVFPFCTENDYVASGINYKVTKMPVKSKRTKCWSRPIMKEDMADNGVMAYPLYKRSSSILQGLVGSTPNQRFCPMAEVFVDDRYNIL
ncbi:hypothetical protein KIN20_009421 [Parelaphostrongylus tenuis]|uniref:Leishmanolysin-like peptidase n=1 Tax=Parelaphostrongylus tenuis TaxID=148309 RepID=A0AAD5QI93_PARTN|nr:hypothetical protein KIN20_009421 [Parelaphostrongylus tenuis]